MPVLSDLRAYAGQASLHRSGKGVGKIYDWLARRHDPGDFFAIPRPDCQLSDFLFKYTKISGKNTRYMRMNYDLAAAVSGR